MSGTARRYDSGRVTAAKGRRNASARRCRVGANGRTC
jgi:hypothetical protein